MPGRPCLGKVFAIAPHQRALHVALDSVVQEVVASRFTDVIFVEAVVVSDILLDAMEVTDLGIVYVLQDPTVGRVSHVGQHLRPRNLELLYLISVKLKLHDIVPFVNHVRRFVRTVVLENIPKQFTTSDHPTPVLNAFMGYAGHPPAKLTMTMSTFLQPGG